MAINKGMLVLFLCALVLCSHLVSCAYQPKKEISYKDLDKGDPDRRIPHNYKRTPVNTYRHGCRKNK
uniref:RALF-like 3 protein n=1 Tax=Primula vulgaris TaxID=175104 RepID=A0A140GNA1_9ERIC|nr:RALF-like 3 protein [Primula vulgaris]